MSRLSVAPKSLTGMLTIPKLMEPLQIALAMAGSSDSGLLATGEAPALFHTAAVFSTGLSP